MRIEYDREVDALYLAIQTRPVHETREVCDGVMVDVDETGQIVGLEILDAAKRFPEALQLDLTAGSAPSERTA